MYLGIMLMQLHDIVKGKNKLLLLKKIIITINNIIIITCRPKISTVVH